MSHHALTALYDNTIHLGWLCPCGYLPGFQLSSSPASSFSKREVALQYCGRLVRKQELIMVHFLEIVFFSKDQDFCEDCTLIALSSQECFADISFFYIICIKCGIGSLSLPS